VTAGGSRYPRFSKTVTGTHITKLDTAIYAPLRVFLAAAGALGACSP
jgi:hypothetical protein